MTWINDFQKSLQEKFISKIKPTIEGVASDNKISRVNSLFSNQHLFNLFQLTLKNDKVDQDTFESVLNLLNQANDGNILPTEQIKKAIKEETGNKVQVNIESVLDSTCNWIDKI